MVLSIMNSLKFRWSTLHQAMTVFLHLYYFTMSLDYILHLATIITFLYRKAYTSHAMVIHSFIHFMWSNIIHAFCRLPSDCMHYTRSIVLLYPLVNILNKYTFSFPWPKKMLSCMYLNSESLLFGCLSKKKKSHFTYLHCLNIESDP